MLYDEVPFDGRIISMAESIIQMATLEQGVPLCYKKQNGNLKVIGPQFILDEWMPSFLKYKNYGETIDSFSNELMSPSDIIQEARRDSVTLDLLGQYELFLSGDSRALCFWCPAIYKHKEEIIKLLKDEKKISQANKEKMPGGKPSVNESLDARIGKPLINTSLEDFKSAIKQYIEFLQEAKSAGIPEKHIEEICWHTLIAYRESRMN